MARSIGNALPDHLLDLLDGRDLAAREGVTLLLLTVTADGWPHVAMLSVGEVVAVGPSRLRAALWLRSTATQNLARERRATLALVQAGAGYSLRSWPSGGPTCGSGTGRSWRRSTWRLPTCWRTSRPTRR